jgi:hypothetical protein
LLKTNKTTPQKHTRRKKDPHFSKKSVESVENKQNEAAKESKERKRAT